MPDTTTTIERPGKLSADARALLRRAIKQSPSWPRYREVHGASLAEMSRDELFAAADTLGIDVNAVIAGADDDSKEAPKEAPKPIPATTTVATPVKAKESTPAMHAPVSPAPAAPLPRETMDATQQLAAAIATIAGQAMGRDEIASLVQREIKSALADVPAVRIEVMREGDVIGKVDGAKHPMFAKLLKAACARDTSGFAPNIWIAGPAGSGKTHGVRMVAQALGADFHFNGALAMPHELLGFIDAGGSYHGTPFRQAYEHGGCYLFDEVDGSDNAALLALNAALANGVATFPDVSIPRHKECRIFAAANTWGFGATADYVGRSKIDAAFLSRFPVKIQWDYDEDLERQISGNEDFARIVQKARANARKAGLKVLITPRDTIAGAALVAAGFTMQEAAESTFLASLTPEQRKMVEGA